MLGFIADFYCPSARLVVECDGPIHDPARDAWRDRLMSERGIVTLRFPNRAVLEDTDAVLGAILARTARRR